MIQLEVIQHKNINKKQLDDIIKVKSHAWSYSYRSQLDWINSNLKDSDIHVLLKKESLAIAYLNLITIQLMINDENVEGLGVGNVCTTIKGEGWGRKIMLETNKIIKNRNKVGLLFCKKELNGFYCKNNWKIINRKYLKFEFEDEKVEVMLFNHSSKIDGISFDGKSF